jgi:radical SAM superfamily enzyme YgiQ (UPF0313 family)
MKTLIISLNSKYIHSSLAPWYLKASCGTEYGEIKVLDFTINEKLDAILGLIYKEKPQVVAFSCYIWNIEAIKALADSLKKVSPAIKIIFGGPEVSYDAYDLMSHNLFIDYIIIGEGEITFKKLLNGIYNNISKFDENAGLVYRIGDEIKINKSSLIIESLESIPSPYTDEMLAAIGNKIAYYESSRGCPFSCSYCLSSISEGVRYFSLQRVQNELLRLINSGVRQIKFVDRTFNCHKERAKEIFNFIIETVKNTSSNINFHFEVAADLFSEELFKLLENAPSGLFQFEIGLQTTNLKTLDIINRRTDIEMISKNVQRLKKMKNIHLHLDLIAGLPGEDYNSFKNSFNQVYSMNPDQLQLGFLKMLKGSRIRAEAKLYNFEYKSNPPYEVLSNNSMSFEEINKLKGLEDILDRYYNSGKFRNSLNFIIKYFSKSAFDLYERLYFFFVNSGLLNKAHSARDLYTILLDFFKEVSSKSEFDIFNELLKIDYLSSDNSNSLPVNINRVNFPGFKELCFDFLKDHNNIKEYLPGFIGITPKSIFKDVHFEIFDFDIKGFEESLITKDRNVIVFDYSQKDRITGLYNYIKTSIIIKKN